MNNLVFIAAQKLRVKPFFSVPQANNTEVNHTRVSLINDQTDAVAYKEMKKKKTE